MSDQVLTSGSDKIFLLGFFSEPIGIGRAAALTASELEAQGFIVIRADLRPLHTRLLSRRPERFGEKNGVLFIHANPPEARIALFALANDTWSTMYRITYWVWESSLAPVNWVHCAKWFHQIWVPSRFVYEAYSNAFRKAGFPEFVTKLKIIPHPVPVSLPATNLEHPPVTALCLFDPKSDLERKNPFAAILAWKKAYPNPTEHRLVVKSHTAARTHRQYQHLLQLTEKRSDIILMPQTLSNKANESLIRSASMLISLHRGEGFGLPMAEAMSMGIPVIATGWSGNMSFMTTENSRLVSYKLVAANRRHNGPMALWAEPDIDDAARAIRELCENSNLRSKLGGNARRDISLLRKKWAKSIIFKR